MSDRVDILCVAAHPDDAELYCSGTLLATMDRGGTFAICDVTAGERGSRGNRETRAEETAEANRRLRLVPQRRWCLEIPDGGISATPEHVSQLVVAIRHFMPAILLIPSPEDRHPDHGRTYQLAHEAWFNAGLRTIITDHDNASQTPHRPAHLLTYDHSWESAPDIIVDISDQFERKLEVLGSYGSQFHLPGRDREERPVEPETFISGTSFMAYQIARMKRNGFQIGVEYGEAFHLVGSPVPFRDLRDLSI